MELIKFAFQGVNIIPTVLLIVTQSYWLIASLGFLDLNFFELDIDVDVEGVETSGLLNALAVFFNIGQVPITLVLSLLSLNFWLLSMLTYFFPIAPGGLIAGLILVPAFLLGMIVTKLQAKVLRTIVFEQKSKNNIEQRVLNKKCQLKGSLRAGQLGQAVIEENKIALLINVMVQFEKDTFEKDEIALVLEKDQEKEVYYISKF